MNDIVFVTLAATGFAVGFLHAVIPTHWLPFVAAARAQHWTNTKTLAVTGFAWQAGFMVGPPAFGALASLQPLAFPLAAAATCALLAVALWRIGRNLGDRSD